MTHAPIARRDDANDPYAWLEQRDDEAVIEYLEAENAWTEQCLATEAPLRERLYEEIKGRIRETDLSLPSPWGPHLYYQRTSAGDEYARHYRCRRPADGSFDVDTASEELLLDPNALANGGFLSIGTICVSPDYRRMAYSLDTAGDEIYRLFVKELDTGDVAELPFENCDGSMTWAADSNTLFYGELDETHRPHKVYRYRLAGERPDEVFHDPDGRFFVHCYLSSSERQLIILANSKTTSEVWILDARTPNEPFRCVSQREEGHEYFLDHGRLGGEWTWLIRSNQHGINFGVYAAPESSPERSSWRTLVDHDPARMIEGVGAHDGAFILSLREGGLPVVEIHRDACEPYRVSLPDAVYNLYVQDTVEFDSPVIRLRYEALNRPAQIRELKLASGEQRVLKETPVEGPFDADAYTSERLWATAPDGTQVPISLVGRKDVLQRGEAAPLYLYGYGAYGASMDAWFSHARLSLLDRGIVFAIAHVRGGGELGEAWYRAGKLKHKTNTFSDFIACAEHLIQTRHTASDRLIISGGSAGGLLIGAVLNARPALLAGAIAEVPFVDVLNTMLNPDLPLTVTEYDEWGDPNEADVHERIKGYAPYENVRAQDYPATLVIAGYNDSRVQYWEAAKWVAKLRATRTDQNLLLLKTEMGAGHGGMSGRYQAFRDVALEYAFVLKVLGLSQLQNSPA